VQLGLLVVIEYYIVGVGRSDQLHREFVRSE
jgi:hypothetical protein